MDKRTKIIIGIFTAVLLTIIVTEIARPKPINWSPSYTSYHKRPFGAHILKEELTAIFPNAKINITNKNSYAYLTNEELDKRSAYIFINTSLHFDKQESHKLLEYAAKGNTILIAGSYLSGVLIDSLKINAVTNYGIREDTIALSFTNSNFKKSNYFYDKGLDNVYFNKVDTSKAKILSYTKHKDYSKKVNFIEMPFGKGKILVNTTPQAFSNYYMLAGNAQYAANALSYIKDGTIIWDDYKKTGRVVITSPMRFVLNQKSLKWSYYLTIASLLLFVLFRAKRKQRIIPVITPLENTSIAFAKTVGTLYYQHKDYDDIIAKKINFFTAYIRTHFYININTITKKTAIVLAAKSGKPLTECTELLDYLLYLKKKTLKTEQELIALNKKIVAFKK